MKIKTKRFGEIEISQDKIIEFKEGILGLEHLKSMILIILEQTKPFYWLQAVEQDVSLPVINPFEIDKEYSPAIEDTVFKELELEDEFDLLILNVSVIPDDITKMSVNMAAPILINISKNLGKQVVVDNPHYEIRQPIFQIISEKMRRGKGNAGSDT